MSLTQQVAVFMSLQISLILCSHSSCVDWLLQDVYEVLKLSMECNPNEIVLAWEVIGMPIELAPNSAYTQVNLEYTCQNMTSGESTTTCLEYLEYNHDDHPWPILSSGNKSVTDDADFYDEEIKCTFRACFSFNRFSLFYDRIYAWNNNSVVINCSDSDATMAAPSPSPSPSVIPLLPSSTPSLLMHDPAAATSSLSATSSSATSYSATNSSATSSTATSSLTTSTSSLTKTTTELSRSNVGGVGSASIPSAEIAFSVISILVILIGGTAIVILIVVCFSYRKWLRKTTSIHYSYDVKQVFEDPLKSVSVYNIDNVSINESNITVLHSLAVQPNDFDASHMNSNRGINFEKLDFSISQTELNNEYEELDSISECSTIALQSNGEQEKPGISLMMKETLHEVVENNVYSAPPTRVLPIKSSSSSENSASLYQRNDCLPEVPPAGTGYKRRDDTVFDGYITEKIQTNETENQRLNSSTESAYEGSSVTSSEQGTPGNGGYLMRTLVEAGYGNNGYCQRTQVYSSSRSPSSYSLLCNEGAELDDYAISDNDRVPGTGKETDVKTSAATLTSAATSEFTSPGYLTNTGQQPEELNKECADFGCTYIGTEYEQSFTNQQYPHANLSDYLGQTSSEQMVAGSVEDTEVSIDICETVNTHSNDTTSSSIIGASDCIGKDSSTFNVGNNTMASHLGAPVGTNSAGYVDGQTIGMAVSQHNTETPVMEDTQLDLCEVDDINTSPAHYPAPPPHIATSLTNNASCDARTDGYTPLPCNALTDDYTLIHTDNNDRSYNTVLVTQPTVAHLNPTDDGYL